MERAVQSTEPVAQGVPPEPQQPRDDSQFTTTHLFIIGSAVAVGIATGAAADGRLNLAGVAAGLSAGIATAVAIRQLLKHR